MVVQAGGARQHRRQHRHDGELDDQGGQEELIRREKPARLGYAEILREILGQRRFSRRPAVMRLTVLDPLLTVVTLPSRHLSILGDGRRLTCV